MTLLREQLPATQDYFAEQGLKLRKGKQWSTTACLLHGGSDSMRVHVNGGWVCMACGAKGGDALSFVMQYEDIDFIAAAKKMGVWHEDGKHHYKQKPRLLPATQAIQLLRTDIAVIAITACDIVSGKVLTELDKNDLVDRAGTINLILEDY